MALSAQKTRPLAIPLTIESPGQTCRPNLVAQLPLAQILLALTLLETQPTPVVLILEAINWPPVAVPLQLMEVEFTVVELTVVILPVSAVTVLKVPLSA